MVDAAFATPLLLTLTSAKPRRCHPTGVSLPWPISHRQLRTLPVQLMGTGLERSCSSRTRTPSSHQPPDERDAREDGGCTEGQG